jgi:pseudaminic acid cytidylyltransferase
MINYAIIPARGGSKRIPRKNVRLFTGKPMIAHSIEAAKRSGVFEKIIVTSDDPETIALAEECGAEAPFVRPAWLSDDFAGTDEVMLHALQWLNEHGVTLDYFCCIYATAPLLRPEYIQQGLERLIEEDASTAFSVTSFSYPIFRALKILQNGRIELFWPEHMDSRSQDLPEAYHDAGQFYWADARKFLRQPRLLSPDSVPVILPRCLVQDIDTLEDWKMAEMLFEALTKISEESTP